MQSHKPNGLKPISISIYVLYSFWALSFNATAEDTNTNEQLLQQWNTQNAGADVPTLKPQADGGTKIEWHGAVLYNQYAVDIDTSNDFGSALNQGGQRLLQLQSDLRGTSQQGDVSYFQLAATATSDRAVLSDFGRQINTVQLGRTGLGYLVAVGDVAPNFSNLSSALGVRGLIAQRQVNQLNLTGYSGLVVPTWEFLESRVPRNQLVKEVQGAKVEYAFTDTFKTYITGQHGRDRRDSADIALPESSLQSASGGFSYIHENWQILGETARSHFKQQGFDGFNGNATVIDANWRNQALALRVGYHDVEAGFASLSQAAQPGVRERYLGGDWAAASWINLGLDLRNSKNFTLETEFTPEQVTETDAASMKANINFGSNHPNWNLALQQTFARIRDPLDLLSRQSQGNMTLNYARENWNASFGYGLTKMRSEASPASDSEKDTWLAALGHAWSNQDALTAATWSIGSQLNASLEQQRLSSGLDTDTFNASLNLNAQHIVWGNLNVGFGQGYITRPFNTTLRTSNVQLDATHNISKAGSVKVYARETRRNKNDDALFAAEQICGVQVSYTF